MELELLKILPVKIIQGLKRKRYYQIGKYKCSCGREFEARIESVRSGLTKSCGCLRKVTATKHGRWRSKIHGVWLDMKKRCKGTGGKGSRDTKNYKDRGITYDPRWEDFSNFLEDMGEIPMKDGIRYSLDRIDVNGNYCKENCRWADDITQQNNKRNNRFIEWKGRKMTLQQWSREVGICPSTISLRLKKGWTVDKALTEKPIPRRVLKRRKENV